MKIERFNLVLFLTFSVAIAALSKTAIAENTTVRTVTTKEEQQKLLKNASIKLKGNESKAERNALAKISIDEAKKTALQAVPGKIHEAELEKEGGFLVYSIEIQSKGKNHDLKIDAGNGLVLYDDLIPEDSDDENDAE